jgi:hypothetical protein
MRHGIQRAAAVAIMVLGVGAAAPEVSAEPNKILYELQERCAKTAAAKFARDHPEGPESNTKDTFTIRKYENHYDAASNKCFSKDTTRILKYASKSDPGYTITLMTLFDVNENKQYGYFWGESYNDLPHKCEVKDKPCHSEDEWRELIKPYMEN